MSEFNLIPLEYQNKIRLRRDIIKFAYVYAAIIVIALLAFIWMSSDIRQFKEKLNTVKSNQFSQQLINAQIKVLGHKQDKLQNRYRALNRLSSGLTVMQLMQSFDRALNYQIKFSSFEYIRNQVSSSLQNRINSKQLIGSRAVNKDNNEYSSIRVHGSSNNHASMAQFMRSLGQQSEVLNVDLLSSKALQSQEGDKIVFELLVFINNDEVLTR